LAERSDRPREAKGIKLFPLRRSVDQRGYHYEHVAVAFDRSKRIAEVTIRGPSSAQPTTIKEITHLGAGWWPLAFARELDDAMLMLRTNEPELGIWILRSEGDLNLLLALGQTIMTLLSHWLIRETVGLLRRTYARLEVSSRTLYALVERQSCFAGVLFELVLASDRAYMLASGGDATGPRIALDSLNFGLLPTINGRSRLATRFHDSAETLVSLGRLKGHRLAIEERASLSPDALTGLEASLRFPGPESLQTKIFARLSAWQNWVFHRPNATGEQGSLKVFGSGAKPRFDWERA
jgi:benzoyl-CoA-dihydrodiol lyase